MKAAQQVHPSPFISPNQALKDAIFAKLSMPQPDHAMRIGTLNKFGFMFAKIDPLSQEFINHAIHPDNKNKTALEIGGAYGNIAEICLENGAQDYILNDLDERHLQIFALNLHQQNKNHLFEHVRLLPGAFPNNHLAPGSVHAGLMNKVLHFFTPDALQETIKNLHTITAPNGVWFILTISPYCPTFESFVPIYLENRKQGKQFPGYCPDVHSYSTETTGGKTCATLPTYFLFMDSLELSQIFKETGFRIEKEYGFNVPWGDNPEWCEGNGFVGIKIRKI